ncbi:MAG: hypothetical protein AAB874_06395 [Patescibacteria group bacterium]
MFSDKDFRQRGPFNGAIETSEAELQELPAPHLLDLFAYFHNYRTLAIAKLYPRVVIWSVGLEFPNPQIMRSQKGWPHNYYEVNFDVLALLQRFEPDSVHNIHIIYALLDNDYCNAVFEWCYAVLKPGGKLTTLDFKENSRAIPQRLTQIGFSCRTTKLDKIDHLSDFVQKHDGFYGMDLQRIVANK